MSRTIDECVFLKLCKLQHQSIIEGVSSQYMMSSDIEYIAVYSSSCLYTATFPRISKSPRSNFLAPSHQPIKRLESTKISFLANKKLLQIWFTGTWPDTYVFCKYNINIGLQIFRTFRKRSSTRRAKRGVSKERKRLN